MHSKREDLWWYQSPTGDAVGAEFSSKAIAEAKRIEFATIDRAQTILNNYCLYGEFGAWGISSALTVSTPALRRNVIATGVDTIVSELLQTPPRAMFISRGGTWFDRRTARKLTSWGDDVSEEQDLEELRAQFYRDGLIAGCGFLQPYVLGKEMKTRRIFPCNVLIDDRNCGDHPPRQMFIRGFIDRHHLASVAKDMGRWSKAMEEAIEYAPDSSESIWALSEPGNAGETNDLIEVWECWHLPSKEDGDDGVYAIVIGGSTLLYRPYKRKKFPVVDFRPTKNTKGWWGISVVSRAGPLQVALNDIMKRIDEAMEYHARMVIIYPPAGGTFKDHLTNMAGTTAEHPNPERIRAFAPEPMPAQAYEHRDHLRQAILEEFAVNELQSQGTIPANLESGKALRVLTDTGSRRFIDFKRCGERSHARYMNEAVHCMRQLQEGNRSVKVLYKRFGVPVEIEWSKLNPDDKRFRIKTFPASSLPQEPAGRIQTLDDMRADGVLDNETFYSLALDVPDTEGAIAEFTAPIDFIRYQIDTMLDENKYVAPWPTAPLERGVQIANSVIFREKMNGCPDDRLDLIRAWIDKANGYLKIATAAMQPAAPPMPMDAAAMPPADPMTGMPMAPPVDPMTGMPLAPPGPPMGAPGMPPEMMAPQMPMAA